MVVRQSVEISFRGSLPKQVATAVNPRPTGRLAAVGALVTDDRQGDRAVGDLRAGRLWGAQRHSRRVGARDAGGIAAAVRPFDGLYGHRRAGDLGRPQSGRAFRAADAEGKADGCSCSGLARRSSPLPDVPGEENGGGGTGKAGEPAGAEAEHPGGELRRPAE